MYTEYDSQVFGIACGDERRLQQILISLMSYALRYTQSYSIKLSLLRHGTDITFIIDIGQGIDDFQL